MNSVLAPALRKYAVVFIDDVLNYSKTWLEHLEHIKQIFLLLQKHNFKVKLSKCSFAKTELAYLGHVINAQGVATDPQKGCYCQRLDHSFFSQGSQKFLRSSRLL